MPETVTSFGAVTADGWLYVCGGHRGTRHEYTADTVSGAFHRLNLREGGAWQALPAITPAQGAPLVAWDGRILRPGGMAARNRAGEPTDLQSKCSLEIFDIAGGRWMSGVAMPSPRSSHDAVVWNGVLYVGGGWQLAGSASGGRWVDTVWSLDLRRAGAVWECVPQPFRRRALAMAAAGGRIYFMGGIDAEGGPSRAVDILEPETGVWTVGPELPEGPMQGFGSSAIALDDRVYWSGMAGDVMELAPGSAAWRPVGRLAHPRFFHQLVTAGERQLVALGGEGAGGKRGDLERLEIWAAG